MNSKKAKITLVGAGPGDEELITLKGLRALKSADVVLYDALIGTGLLEYAGKSTLKVYVGKRAGRHGYTQDEINSLTVHYALQYGHVVRLKGGDPFVLGRGYEEIDHAASFGIETEVVPGVSSATALSGLQKVPLTSRGVSESFWVITGTTQKRQFSQDMALAAQSTATVVILMGMGRLREIMRTFAQYGRAETPAMIVQNGSMPDEKVAFGTVATMADIAVEEQMGSPAVIVVGQTVALHPMANAKTAECAEA